MHYLRKTLHINIKENLQTSNLLQNTIIYYKLQHREANCTSKVTVNHTASLIKSSTTLSRTRSTSGLRKSSETKLGEALEHDD